MKPRYCLLTALLALLLLLTACQNTEPDPSDRETFPKETYTEVAGADMVFQSGLNRDGYPADSTVGAWLTKCAASDRDEQFDAYTLRHEAADGDSTTFTYFIYYPHGATPMTATPELLEGESGYVINLTYEAGDSTDGYTLCTLSVTLPTREAPRLRLLYDGDVLGQLATVSEMPLL